jgi:NADP-dependent 3-hydroxy acid dehydrogenase YdfG
VSKRFCEHFLVTEDSAVPLPQGGRVAIVTGGSAGLGFAIAGALARTGSTVVLAGRSAERCQQAATRLTAETGASALSQANSAISLLGVRVP